MLVAFHTFQYSVFRLETLQVYAGSGEDEGIAAFHRGDPNLHRIPLRTSGLQGYERTGTPAASSSGCTS
jgi:hypothetical protein